MISPSTHSGVLLFLLILAIAISCDVDGSSILFLSPITAPSHSNFFKPVVKALADRGHFVTYWNGLKPDNYAQSDNLRQLYSPQLDGFNSDYQIGFHDRHSQRQFQLFFDIPARLAIYCQAIYQDPIFHQLMNNSKKSYDLIIVEGILNDCVLPLVGILDAPFIYMNGIAPTPWLLEAVGSPLALDHFPNPGFSFADEMNLWQRTFNTISSLVGVYFRHWFVTPVVDKVAYDMLGGNLTTTIAEIENRYLSLLITNTHFSINYQLPTSPAVIQAGGLHCVSAKSLPEELKSFVEGSGDAGFIIVSFGSILRGADVSDDVRRLFLSTFARLPQRVLWKWEEKSRGDDSVPSNVKLLPWMPQQDLLGHPKIRLFITHGGLFSVQEAVYHGVPFIALPVFADQPINAQKAQDDGYAIRLDWDNLTEEILYSSIQTIFSDPRFFSTTYEILN
jgi:glucuronosyltransferase